ncbi:HpcH/HpaI aldolase/citrate lyase family protein [Euzebya tangerina]|uniref:HpcH/HpaI aldolase/citrate lyase family protein n=1 Tax=Euzebya tangerina TaxID=591198 RepID=UPI00196A932E|nr:CoA ester lyase [Euzebya tangerina]
MSDSPLTRPRRTCLAVPGSSPKMLSKAAGLPVDEVFLDLEDSVAPGEKAQARRNVIATLEDTEFGDKTVVVRVNAVDTHFCHRDIIDVVGTAGEYIDCVMVPKVQNPGQIEFVDHLLRMVEVESELPHRIGLEAQIEDAQGLTNIDDIAFASDRLETLILGPGDMAAALGMPGTTLGERTASYPGDMWHAVLMRILIAARNAGIQAIDGPYAKIKDSDGLREVAEMAKALGFDGKWVLHPAQVDVVNEVFSPTQEEFDHAMALLDAYDRATGAEGTGALMFGDVMIDEASAKMAQVVAGRGQAAGLQPSA